MAPTLRAPEQATWWERRAGKLVQSWGASTYATPLLTHLLFVLFVAYYGVLVVLAVEFLLLAVGLYQSFLTSPADNWLALPAAMLMTAVVARLAVELVMGMAGLVTNKYDGANPPVFGPLLNESNSPDLQKLIALVAERTRGPLPNEIRVSPDANCYVCENRRFSLSTNRSLVLVIGLPHLTVLTATELKIILAHELAHFAGGDTRLGVFLHRFLESLRDRSGNSTVYQWQWGDPVHWLRWLYFKGAQLIAAPVWQSQRIACRCRQCPGLRRTARRPNTPPRVAAGRAVPRGARAAPAGARGWQPERGERVRCLR